MAQNIAKDRRKFLLTMSKLQADIHTLFSKIVLGTYNDADPDTQELYKIHKHLQSKK